MINNDTERQMAIGKEIQYKDRVHQMGIIELQQKTKSWDGYMKDTTDS